MPPKRKSNANDIDDEIRVASPEPGPSKPKPSKKARTLAEADADGAATTASGSKSRSKAAAAAEPPKHWSEVILEGELEGNVPVYDDCNDVRRKIRELQKSADFKVTHWLQEIGGINTNSLSRFMRDTGATIGASNGTYPAAYKYFEKVRIAEGKKKTPKRIRNEMEHPNGFPLENRRKMWVMGPARATRRR